VNLREAKDAFRAHVQAASGCPVRWASKEDGTAPDGDVSPGAVAYLNVTSGKILGTSEDFIEQDGRLQVNETTLSRFVVTVTFESSDGRDNYDALFYVQKTSRVLKRQLYAFSANENDFHIVVNDSRQGPNLVDEDATVTTGALELIWIFRHTEVSPMSGAPARTQGPGLETVEIIETLGAVGKLEDLAPEPAGLVFSGSATLSAL
jgi:hypothetical protein